MVGGVDDLAIPRLSPDNTELLYLVAPKRAASSHTVRIMQVPLSGGPPQLVLEGPWIWNHQCARLPSRLCIYTPSETNQQRFFRFDPVTGASSEIATAKITGSQARFLLVGVCRQMASILRQRSGRPTISPLFAYCPQTATHKNCYWYRDGDRLVASTGRQIVKACGLGQLTMLRPWSVQMPGHY
jgi:hypothetical protein